MKLPRAPLRRRVPRHRRILGLGDQPHPALEEDVVVRPLHQYADAVAEAHQVHHVHEEPEEPGEVARKAQLSVEETRHRLVPANRREVALVEVAEGFKRLPRDVPQDVCPRVFAHLVRRRRDPGYPLAVRLMHRGAIAHHVHAIVARYREGLLHHHAPHTVQRRIERLGERRGRIARRPKHRLGRDVLIPDMHAMLRDVGDHRIRPHFDAESREIAQCALG